MTAREFLEWAGFEVNEHTLSRLTDYIQSNIDFSQFPDANVVTEDGTPLNECAEEPARFQEWMEGGIQTMEKNTKMTGYNDLKAWMERQYGASRAEVTITCNGQTYIGHMYGSDECFDGNEFYQYFLTDDALLELYYHIPEGCTDFGTIDYSAPYDVRAEDARYWLDYVI